LLGPAFCDGIGIKGREVKALQRSREGQSVPPTIFSARCGEQLLRLGIRCAAPLNITALWEELEGLTCETNR
jgi:hypothetical protein